MRPTVASEVVRLPASAEQSIESVAAYVVDRQPDPWLQLKALHDWTATRMTYDVEAGMRLTEGWRVFLPGSAAGRPLSSCYHAWEPGEDGTLPFLCPERAANGTWVLDPKAHIVASSVDLIPDPEAVFASRAGMCADYAALLTALGRAAGLDVHYVTGRVRSLSSSIMQAGLVEEVTKNHAWNVARVGGEERPIDVTWDAGACSWGECEAIMTDWLFTPPEVFGWTHTADDPRWRFGGDSARGPGFSTRPLLNPRFFALGLVLVSPTTQPVSSRRDAELVIHAPKDIAIDVLPHPDCTVRATGTLRIARCHFGIEPPREVLIAAKPHGERYAVVGAVAVSPTIPRTAED